MAGSLAALTYGRAADRKPATGAIISIGHLMVRIERPEEGEEAPISNAALDSKREFIGASGFTSGEGWRGGK